MAYLGLTSIPIHQFGADRNTIHKAKLLRKRMTNAETVLWAVLRKHQVLGCRFRRQQPIGHYIVDFFCFETLLAVEIDGESHLGKEEYDNLRLSELKDLGIKVIIFSNEEVLDDLNTVILKIRSKINEIRILRKEKNVL